MPIKLLQTIGIFDFHKSIHPIEIRTTMRVYGPSSSICSNPDSPSVQGRLKQKNVNTQLPNMKNLWYIFMPISNKFSTHIYTATIHSIHSH